MSEIEEFNPLTFEKRLMHLKDTQESIQSLSSWCMKQREHHKRIVSSWLSVLKRVKIEQRLVLFYLANDVIQYSKRKNYEFVESWGLNLQKATPLVRDEKVRPKILRIFKIWEQRAVYDVEFLSDLTGLLSAGAVKKNDDESFDFQPQQLVNKIKQCSALDADTDLRLKHIHDSHLQLSDADALCANLKVKDEVNHTTSWLLIHNKLARDLIESEGTNRLKRWLTQDLDKQMITIDLEDRSHKDDVEKELNEGIACVERYTQALQREIVAREALLALLATANQYYSTQRGEVKVVAYAYKNFGSRVRALKRKLDVLVETLPPRPKNAGAIGTVGGIRGGDESPAESPPRAEDVPSPNADFDLDLPGGDSDDLSYNIDRTFNSTVTADGSLYNLGLSSFLTSANTMALFNDVKDSGINSANKIEVINSRPNDKQDFNINDFLKTLVPNDNSNNADNNSVISAAMSQKSQDALPGLDLLTPESTGLPAPPVSFYGAMDNAGDDADVYSENAQWNTNPNTWSMPPAPVPPPFPETPESPPPAATPILPPRTVLARGPERPIGDVDHRGALPPPPPPPVLPLPLLAGIEDVDHRMLPALPPRPPPSAPAHHVTDVDHRNLIPLTSRPPPRLPAPPNQADQDYRVPPVMAPSDIVESVDMDLSEDEDQQGMFPNQETRRNSFNNNKVLVGGDNGKLNHKDTNIRPIREDPRREPPPMSNPFDNMPTELKDFNTPFPKFPPNFQRIDNEEVDMMPRNPSPEFEYNEPPEFQDPRQFNNQRFPRNWGPRTNVRPQFGPGPPFWPRNGPRTPNRWMGPRPQRFW